jgi:hypothetical protein
MTSTDNCCNTEKEMEEKHLNDYIAQLGEKEKIAYEIAKSHLGTSFSLKKSIGYKEWVKKNGNKKNTT